MRGGTQMAAELTNNNIRQVFNNCLMIQVLHH